MNLKDKFNSRLKGVEAFNKQNKLSKKHSDYVHIQGFFDEFIDFTNCEKESSGVFLIGNFFIAFSGHIGKYMEAKVYQSGLPNLKSEIDAWLETGEKLPITLLSENKYDVGQLVYHYRKQHPLLNERFKDGYYNYSTPITPTVEVPKITKPIEPAIPPLEDIKNSNTVGVKIKELKEMYQHLLDKINNPTSNGLNYEDYKTIRNVIDIFEYKLKQIIESKSDDEKKEILKTLPRRFKAKLIDEIPIEDEKISNNNDTINISINITINTI